jgi:hypothetical protein
MYRNGVFVTPLQHNGKFDCYNKNVGSRQKFLQNYSYLAVEKNVWPGKFGGPIGKNSRIFCSLTEMLSKLYLEKRRIFRQRCTSTIQQ